MRRCSATRVTRRSAIVIGSVSNYATRMVAPGVPLTLLLAVIGVDRLLTGRRAAVGDGQAQRPD